MRRRGSSLGTSRLERTGTVILLLLVPFIAAMGSGRALRLLGSPSDNKAMVAWGDRLFLVGFALCILDVSLMFLLARLAPSQQTVRRDPEQDDNKP